MKNTGKQFEATVERVLAQYQRQGLLRMVKVDPPVRIYGGKVVFQANPFLDYIGTWTERGGRMVVMEVKTTKEPRLYLGSGGLSQNQQAALMHWTTAGAAAFVLWNHDTGTGLGNTYFLTWQRIKAVLVFGARKSLVPGDGVLVKQGTGFVLIDFLAEMKREWCGTGQYES